MKKTILMLLMACAVTISHAQEQKYTIKGRTEAIPTDGKLTLIRYDLVNGRRDDTVTIGPDGLFSFIGTVPAPQIGQLIFKSGNNQGSAVFFLENGQIKINLKKEDGFPELSGTPLNKDFNDYYIMMGRLLDSVNATQHSGAPYTQFSKELKTEKLHLMQKFVPGHRNSLLTVYQLNNQVARFPDEVSELVKMYNKLNPEVQKTKEGKDMATLIKGLSSNKIGDTALNFSMPDTNGKTVSLTDFRGKYVLLDFWATWCAPCLEEMPNVVNAYGKYKNKDFTIVGVSLDRPDTKALWIKMIKDQHMDWVQISDLKWWNSQAALLYNIQGVPANFLIDPSGKIIEINLRGARLQEKLAEIFKAK